MDPNYHPASIGAVSVVTGGLQLGVPYHFVMASLRGRTTPSNSLFLNNPPLTHQRRPEALLLLRAVVKSSQ